jgi:hypothetical protein
MSFLSQNQSINCKNAFNIFESSFAQPLFVLLFKKTSISSIKTIQGVSISLNISSNFLTDSFTIGESISFGLST